MAKQPTPAKKPTSAAKAAGAAHPAAKNGAKIGGKSSAKPASKSEASKSAKSGKPTGKAKAKAGEKPEAAAPAKAPVPAPPVEKKSRNDLAPKILHMIAEEMAIEEAELTASASFREDLGLDEIDIAELLMQAEATFAVGTFSEEDWESCETVGDLIAAIEKRVAAQRGKKSAGKDAKAKGAKK